MRSESLTCRFALQIIRAAVAADAGDDGEAFKLAPAAGPLLAGPYQRRAQIQRWAAQETQNRQWLFCEDFIVNSVQDEFCHFLQAVTLHSQIKDQEASTLEAVRTIQQTTIAVHKVDLQI